MKDGGEGTGSPVKNAFSETRSRFGSREKGFRYAATATLLLLSLTGMTISQPGDGPPEPPGCIGDHSRREQSETCTAYPGSATAYWEQKAAESTPATPVR